jgi:hypothetical protein
MLSKNLFAWQMGIIVLIVTSLTLLTACGDDSAPPEPTPYQGVRTWLLVKGPDTPLQAGRPVTVKSRTEDSRHKVSHVELYAVQWPGSERELLIRSDAAPFDQTFYTAAQTFTPNQVGHYVIKVVGYNKLGEKAESDYIGFDVE